MTAHLVVREESLVATAPGGAVLTFDRAGRLYAAFLEGRFYRRGVDGRVVEKFTRGEPERRTLPPAAAAEIVRRALDLAREVEGLDAHALIRDLDADAARFRAVYEGSVPVLPPDVYRALVLQATVGCPHNACRFCNLYRDRPYRARSAPGFARHVREVGEAFGAGITMRRGVFLGDADALALGAQRLARFCALAHASPAARAGLYCFGAVFTGPRAHARAGWEALREAGLRRVYFGIETGHDPLRRKLGKPGAGADALRWVHALKEAGIGVGLIFLLGVGGEEHVRDSAAFCRDARLEADDLVYLSPLVRSDGRLARGRCHAQEKTLREAIGEGPRVAVYDLRAFVY
ncbi:MAG: radical SAM protein [Planctomycetota bacterium]